MRQCQECGTFSTDDTVFCSVCGKRFSDISDTALEIPQPELQCAKKEFRNQPILETMHPEVMPILQRIELFLEDSEFDRADEYCERVLDIEPTNAESYIDKLLVEYKCSTREQLKNGASSIANSKNYAKVMRFGNKKQKAFVIDSEKSIQNQIANIKKEAGQINAHKEDVTISEPIMEFIHQDDKLEDEQEYYVDIICPYCHEELSYTNWQIKVGGLICPMCDAQFDFNEGLRR